MTWCRSDQEDQIASSNSNQTNNTRSSNNDERTLTCPSCGHKIELQDQPGIHDLPGLPAGVKFDPSDQEILEHLEAKALSSDIISRRPHPLLDEFIPTIEGENGICYTHPEKLPGVSKDGQVRHFFHRPSKAYTTGTRKRRKVHTAEDGSETRWHKTGKTRPVLCNGASKGFKKILVLYTNYGRQRKPEKTNWVMHQYHLGNTEEEKDGQLVVSKVFYQTQPRQCGTLSIKDSSVDHDEGKVMKKTTTTTTTASMAKSSDLLEYYNPTFISFDQGSHSREAHHQTKTTTTTTTQLMIPNMVLHQGGDESFVHHLTSDASKGKMVGQ